MTSLQLQCAQCAKPGANSFCVGCNGAPDLEDRPQKTAYCNTCCQESHWKAHKASCLAFRKRKMLFRAGETAQKLFYIFHREVFDKSFRAFEDKGVNMILYEDEHEDISELSDAQAYEKSLVPFSDQLFKKEHDEEAILAYNASTDLSLFLHFPLSLMLEDICRDIEELHVVVINRKRELNLVPPNGTLKSPLLGHDLVRVKLKNGEMYAVDIAGAQQGYYEPVISWEYSIHTRVKTIERTAPFGQAERDYETTFNLTTLCPEAAHMMKKCWSSIVAEYISVSETTTPMAQMLKLADSDFQVTQANFLGDLADYLTNMKTMFREQGFLFPFSRLKWLTRKSLGLLSNGSSFVTFTCRPLQRGEPKGHDRSPYFRIPVEWLARVMNTFRSSVFMLCRLERAALSSKNELVQRKLSHDV